MTAFWPLEWGGIRYRTHPSSTNALRLSRGVKRRHFLLRRSQPPASPFVTVAPQEPPLLLWATRPCGYRSFVGYPVQLNARVLAIQFSQVWVGAAS